MVLSDPCERVVQFPRDRDSKVKNLWCTEKGCDGDSFQIAATKSLPNALSLIGTQTSFSTNPEPSTQQPRLSTRTFDSGRDFITLNVLLPSSGWRPGVLLSSLLIAKTNQSVLTALSWQSCPGETVAAPVLPFFCLLQLEKELWTLLCLRMPKVCVLSYTSTGNCEIWPEELFCQLCLCHSWDTGGPCTKTDTKLEASIVFPWLKARDRCEKSSWCTMCKKLHVLVFSLCGFNFAQTVAKVLCFN